MCDCEPAKVYVETWPRARKPHRCEECPRTIQAGELYQRIFGVWGLSAQTFSTCATCAQVRRFLASILDACDCIAFGDLSTALLEDFSIGHLADALTTEENAKGLGAALGMMYRRLIDDADIWEGEREGERYPKRAA